MRILRVDTMVAAMTVLLCCHLAKADEVRWSLRTSVSTASTSLATDTHSIYVLGASRLNLHKVNRSNGALMWSIQLFNATDANSGFDDLTLTAMPSALIVSNSSLLLSINATSGDLLWAKDSLQLLMPTLYTFSSLGLFSAVGYSSVQTFDALSGHLVWAYQTGGGISTWIMDLVATDNTLVLLSSTFSDWENSSGVLLDAATGAVTLTVDRAQGCNHVSSHNQQYLACTTLHPNSTNLQATVIDLTAKKILWQRDLGVKGRQAFVLVTLYVVKEILVVCRGTNTPRITGWAAALDVVDGGAPLWNVSLSYALGALGASLTPFEGGYIVPCYGKTGRGFEPVSFMSVNVTTGVALFELRPPTTFTAVIDTAGDSLIFPNLMGWTRWVRDGNVEVLAPAFSKLDQFQGMGTVVADGPSSYIVISGSEVAKYDY